MKKTLTFVLAALLALSVVGCKNAENNEKDPKDSETKVEENISDGSETKEDSDTSVNNQHNSEDTVPPVGTENKDNNTPETAPDEENAPAEGKDETPDNNGNKQENNKEETYEKDNKKEEKPDKEDDEPTPPPTTSSLGVEIPGIKKQTIIDTDLCSITVTGFKDDGVFGPSLCVDLKNKSKDVNYNFLIKDSYVNSVYTPMYLYSEVAAGKTVSQEIPLSVSELVKYGLDKLTDIEITFEVKDSNASWIDVPAVLETVNIQPYGKNSVSKFNIKDQHLLNVYIDNDYAKVGALSYYKNDIYGYCIDLFIENRTNGNICVKFEDTTVNGKLLDPYVYEVVNNGKRSIARVDWPVSDFESNGIKTFEEIKFTLVVANSDNVAGKNYSSDEITLSFGA